MENLGRMFSTGLEKVKEASNSVLTKDSPLEKNLKEACANTNWGASTSLLAEIASASFEYTGYFVIMKYVWEAVTDKPSRWRRVLKTLTLIEYLIKNGAERTVDEIREGLFRIRVLMDFHYTEEGRDKGTGVREKAKWVVELVNDIELLKQERLKASQNRHKFVGIGGRGERSGPTQCQRGMMENSVSSSHSYMDTLYSSGAKYDPHISGYKDHRSATFSKETSHAERTLRSEYEREGEKEEARAQQARDKARLEREKRKAMMEKEKSGNEHGRRGSASSGGAPRRDSSGGSKGDGASDRGGDSDSDRHSDSSRSTGSGRRRHQAGGSRGGGLEPPPRYDHDHHHNKSNKNEINASSSHRKSNKVGTHNESRHQRSGKLGASGGTGTPKNKNNSMATSKSSKPSSPNLIDFSTSLFDDENSGSWGNSSEQPSPQWDAFQSAAPVASTGSTYTPTKMAEGGMGQFDPFQGGIDNYNTKTNNVPTPHSSMMTTTASAGGTGTPGSAGDDLFGGFQAAAPNTNQFSTNTFIPSAMPQQLTVNNQMNLSAGMPPQQYQGLQQQSQQQQQQQQLFNSLNVHQINKSPTETDVFASYASPAVKPPPTTNPANSSFASTSSLNLPAGSFNVNTSPMAVNKSGGGALPPRSNNPFGTGMQTSSTGMPPSTTSTNNRKNEEIANSGFFSDLNSSLFDPSLVDGNRQTGKGGAGNTPQSAAVGLPMQQQSAMAHPMGAVNPQMKAMNQPVPTGSLNAHSGTPQQLQFQQQHQQLQQLQFQPQQPSPFVNNYSAGQGGVGVPVQQPWPPMNRF